MSPAWSPDGQWLAYVSFETKHSAIYVQLVRTGERRQVSARAGINGAPAWSPDGKQARADLRQQRRQSRHLRPRPRNPGADAHHGRSGDRYRAGLVPRRHNAVLHLRPRRSPQIYQIAAVPGARPKRITFGGSYNARPRVSADGTQLAMVTLDNGNYRIAVQDLATATRCVSSRTAGWTNRRASRPMGLHLSIAERDGSRGALATVSTDGLTGLRLKSAQGEVREPVWGPFVP